MLAAGAEPAFVAVIEPRGGAEMAVIAKGLRTLCGRLRVYGGLRIWVFHRSGHDGEVEINSYLRQSDSPERRAGMRRRLNRPSARDTENPSRAIGYVPLETMVQYSNSDKARAEWQATVEALVVNGAPPFGLIVHLGRGTARDIEQDIAALTPLMTDTTLLAVAHQERKGPAGAFGRLCRDGWGGVVVGGTGLLQRRREAPAAKE